MACSPFRHPAFNLVRAAAYLKLTSSVMHLNFQFINVFVCIMYKRKYHKKWYSRICFYVKLLRRVNRFFFTIYSKHYNFSRNTIKSEITIIIKKQSWVFSPHNIIIFIIFVFLFLNLQLPYQLNIICWIIFNSLFFHLKRCVWFCSGWWWWWSSLDNVTSAVADW